MLLDFPLETPLTACYWCKRTTICSIRRRDLYVLLVRATWTCYLYVLLARATVDGGVRGGRNTHFCPYPFPLHGHVGGNQRSLSPLPLQYLGMQKIVCGPLCPTIPLISHTKGKAWLSPSLTNRRSVQPLFPSVPCPLSERQALQHISPIPTLSSQISWMWRGRFTGPCILYFLTPTPLPLFPFNLHLRSTEGNPSPLYPPTCTSLTPDTFVLCIPASVTRSFIFLKRRPSRNGI